MLARPGALRARTHLRQLEVFERLTSERADLGHDARQVLFREGAHTVETRACQKDDAGQPLKALKCGMAPGNGAKPRKAVNWFNWRTGMCGVTSRAR